jgi:hypothetical protein
MDFSASATTKDAARTWRRRSCTPPRFSSTLPDSVVNRERHYVGLTSDLTEIGMQSADFADAGCLCC